MADTPGITTCNSGNASANGGIINFLQDANYSWGETLTVSHKVTVIIV